MWVVMNAMGCLKYSYKNIYSTIHSQALLLAPILLMGLKSLDSTAGTKPTTEAQLDSAAFKMEWFSRSCDPAKVSMGFVFSGEGSSFSWDCFFFCIFSWGGADMRSASQYKPT
jgi:hypothetical protein